LNILLQISDHCTAAYTSNGPAIIAVMRYGVYYLLGVVVLNCKSLGANYGFSSGVQLPALRWEQIDVLSESAFGRNLGTLVSFKHAPLSDIPTR
jgi:hypothetical protein